MQIFKSNLPTSINKLWLLPWLSYSQIQTCSSSSNLDGCWRQAVGIWISSKNPRVTVLENKKKNWFEMLILVIFLLSKTWRIYLEHLLGNSFWFFQWSIHSWMDEILQICTSLLYDDYLRRGRWKNRQFLVNQIAQCTNQY